MSFRPSSAVRWGLSLLSVICAAQVAAVSDAEDEVDKPKVHEKYEKEKTNAAKLIEALQLFRNRRNNGTFASAPSTLQGDLPPATGGGGSEPRRQEGLLEEAGTGSVNTGNDVTTMNKEELLAYTMRKYGPNSVHGAKKTRKGPQKLVKNTTSLDSAANINQPTIAGSSMDDHSLVQEPDGVDDKKVKLKPDDNDYFLSEEPNCVDATRRRNSNPVS